MDLVELVSESRLKRFRNRSYMALGFIIAPFLLPFTIYDVFTGQDYLFSGAIFSVAGVLISNSIVIYRKNKVLIPYRYFFVVIQAMLLWSVANEGQHTVFWFFPIALITMFTDTRIAVRSMFLLSFICAAPAAMHFYETGFALRFLVSYALVILCSDLLLGLLDQMQADIDSHALRDPMTGVYNRRQLMAVLREAIGVGKGNLTQHCLISIDIDNFKSINNDYGHDIGDRIIQDVARLIADNSRESDMLFRVGGEEFTLLVREASEEKAMYIAESIRARVEEAALHSDRDLTISLGVSAYRHGEDIKAWLKRVDENRDQAKDAGRNCVVGPKGIRSNVDLQDPQIA